MMTLDEAIIHAKEVAENNRHDKEQYLAISGDNLCKSDYVKCIKAINKCESCAQDHEQLATWLTELKEYRVKDEKYKWHFRPENGWTEETLPRFIVYDRRNFLVYDDLFCVFSIRRIWSMSTPDKTKNIMAWQEIDIEPFESEE